MVYKDRTYNDQENAKVRLRIVHGIIEKVMLRDEDTDQADIHESFTA